jgi:uncharacterized protein (TIGR03437 family)
MSAQVITTIAGTDFLYPSRPLPALSAPLGYVGGVAADGGGNLYVSDQNNNRVLRLDSSGLLTVIAGNGKVGPSGDGGPAIAASVEVRGPITLDSSGNLFIASGSTVRKVSTDGTIVTVAGNGQYSFSGDGGPAVQASFSNINGLAVDPAGNLYVADSGNERIRRIATNGIVTTFAGSSGGGSNEAFSGDGGPATAARLAWPQAVAVDPAGNVYIADRDNNRIRRVNTAGVISTVAGNGTALVSGDNGPALQSSLWWPSCVASDSVGAVYLCDGGDGVRIRKIKTDGTIVTVAGTGQIGYSGDGGPAVSAGIRNPGGIFVDGAGNLFIADSINYRVRQVTPAGIIHTIAGNGQYGFGGDGGLATLALLNYPVGMTLDASGNLLIADFANDRVRSVSPKGIITTIAGGGPSGIVQVGDGGPATAAFVRRPQRLAYDRAGNLYVTDNTSRIRKISVSGTITTVAGNGVAGFSGDNGPATSASLNGPQAVAVDAAGNIYIGETGRVRRVSTSGIITTIAGTGICSYPDHAVSALAANMCPSDLKFDLNGNLLIAEGQGFKIRRLNPDGTLSVVAGDDRFLGNSPPQGVGDGGIATAAFLGFPAAITLDPLGNLYIAEQTGNRVRQVTADGLIHTIAGTGANGPSLDGGLATSAALFGPKGIAFDSAGNLFISGSDNRIREVFARSVSYQATPASLSFSATAGGSAPGTQTINLSSFVAGLSFTASSSAAWLSVSPSSGSMPAILTVSIDPSSLAAGTYQGTVTITAPNAVPSTTTVAVTLTVKPGTPAALGIDTQNVSFTATQGSGPLTQQLHVLNPGGGSLSFTANASTTSGGSWLSISPANGTATPSSPASLTITATPGSIAPGTYSGTITVIGAGSTVNVAVTLSVSAPTSIILVSQSGLSFTSVAQGGVPLPQNFGILNTGQGSMSWTATTATLSGGDWLQISPSSGTVQRPYLDVSLVTVSIDPSTLAAGTYYGRIQVSAPAANTPQVMTVILTVLPAGLSLGPQIFPTGLIFTGVAGVTPGSQDVQVGNPTGQVNNFQSGIIGTGFSFLPTNATIQPSQPTTLRVFPDFSTLTGGSLQRGTITLQFSDGSSQTISVLILVAPSGSTPAAVETDVFGDRSMAERGYRIELGPNAASGCATQPLQVLYRSLQPNFTAVVGQGKAIEVRVSDGCGNLVGPGGQQAQVSAYFASESVAMTHIGGGVWQGTWKPLTAGPVVVNVYALLQQGGNLVGGQTGALSGVVSAPAPADTTPTVTAQGVVHAASDQGGVPIAPGGLISVYGVNLSDGVGQSNGLPLPQQLNGTQVLLGNQPLPILYTSTGQMNVQVPYGVPVNTQYPLTVQHGNTLSLPQSLVVAAAQPGIFTVNQQGTGQGSIVKSDQVTLAQPGTPAAVGETIVIYCTGLGAVTPAVKEGSPAPTTPPLSTTVNTVTVTIGGKAAQVAFAGLTPGYAGLYQVNAVVPVGITTGDAVPVLLSVAGQDSPPVTMAVR